eukprot:9738361-Heterocapsa_arctica.AAC.1
MGRGLYSWAVQCESALRWPSAARWRPESQGERRLGAGGTRIRAGWWPRFRGVVRVVRRTWAVEWRVPATS